MRLAASLAAGPLLGLVLSGCGGNPEPAPAPSSSGTPSASPSADATPTPPVMPAAARKKTKQGARAAVQHFLEAMAFAGATGDLDPFRATYSAECTRCEAISKGIRQTYGDGGYIRGGAWRPSRIQVHGIEGTVAFVDAVVTYEPQTWVRAAGSPAATSPEKANVLKTFQLLFAGQRWQVGALDPTA